MQRCEEQRENRGGVERCGRKPGMQHAQRERGDPGPKKNEDACGLQSARRGAGTAKFIPVTSEQQDSRKEYEVIIDRLPGKNDDGCYAE